MSMPKRLLGRSRTCPLLATTSKSGPRYLLIVLALAGDSTITRCFFFRAATGLILKVRGQEAGVRDQKTLGPAVVLLCQLATITNLVESRQPPILYLFAGCQVRQG